VAVVVISSNGKGDRAVGSLEVKVPGGQESWSDPYRGANNLTGRSRLRTRKPRKFPPREVDLRDRRERRAARWAAKAHVRNRDTGQQRFLSSPGS
jgi:hypothetical protein